jgi:hypothetical protein
VTPHTAERPPGNPRGYLLESAEGGGILFRCEKNRYGAVADVVTRFDGDIQTFSAAPSGLEGFDSAAAAGSGRHKKP